MFSRTNLSAVIGIVLIAIAFVVFPIILDATDTILSNANISNYTGLQSLVKVAPTIVFVGLLFGGGFLTYRGVTKSRKSSQSRRSLR